MNAEEKQIILNRLRFYEEDRADRKVTFEGASSTNRNMRIFALIRVETVEALARELGVLEKDE